VSVMRGDLANIDLCKKGVAVCDVAVCTNVLISPDPQTRETILNNIFHNLKIGGKLMLLTPAVQSAKRCWRAHIRWVEHCVKNGIKQKRKDMAPEERSIADERCGIYRRDGVRTKHFKKAGLQTMLEKAGFTLCSIARVEYDWSTEFLPPTSFLDNDPPPFDWLTVCTKLNDVKQIVPEAASEQVEARRLSRTGSNHKPKLRVSRLNEALAFSSEQQRHTEKAPATQVEAKGSD